MTLAAGVARTTPASGSGLTTWVGANGRPLSVMACTVIDGRIVEILSMTDAERLASMDLPGRPV